MSSAVVAVRPMYLDLTGAATYVSLSESVWQELVRTGDAPKPRQLSGRRVGWLVSELDEWGFNRPVSALLPPPNTGARKNAKATNAPQNP